MPMPMPLTRPLPPIRPLLTRFDTSPQSLLFKAWVFVGVVVNWIILFITAHGALQLEPRQVGVHGFFFVPICLTLHTTTLYLWNCRASQHDFGIYTRAIFCCASLNVWAGGCVLVYVNTESVMWISTWWFMLLPMILILVNKVMITLIKNPGGVYATQGYWDNW